MKRRVTLLSRGPVEGASEYLSHGKSFTSSPVFVQCASPTTSFSVACAVIYGTFLACIRLSSPVAPPDLIVTLGLEPRVQGKCSRTRPGPRLALANARLAGVTSWKEADMRCHGLGEREIG